MTIYTDTNDALATLSIPFGHNTFHSDDEAFPDTYMIYSMVDGTGKEFADDEEQNRQYRVQVTIFKVDGLSDLPDVDGAMIAAGFSKGPERELPQDVATGHYILAKDYFKLKEKE